MIDAEAQVLVVRGALQDDELEVRIGVHRAADETDLGARLALEVEDLLAPVADVDHRLAGVVLGHQLAVLRRDAEPEHPRPGLVDGEPHPRRGGRAVGRQRHRLRPHDAALVLDVEHDRLAVEPGLADDHVDHQRRPLQRDARSADPANLDVARQRLLPDADGEDRQPLRLQGEQRLAERGFRGVRAVADHDQPGQRQAGQLLARAVEGNAQPRLRAAERQLVLGVHALRRAREAERPHHELVGEGLHETAVGGAELLPHETRARAIVVIGDLHAARIVEQHGEEVLLRDRGLDHQHRPEQADGDEPDQGHAQRGQDDAITRAQSRAAAAIGGDRHHHGDAGRRRRQIRRAPGGEAELSLREDDRAVGKQQLKKAFEQRPSPDPVRTRALCRILLD